MTSTNEIVFLGSHSFTFDLPPTAEEEEYEEFEMVSMRRFEAVRNFRRLDEVLPDGERAFTHAQAVCVSEAVPPKQRRTAMDNLKIVFPGISNFTIELPPAAEHGTADARGFEAVCAFRRLEKWRAIGEPAFVYAQAVAVSEDVFYAFTFFTTTAPTGASVRAVPDLDSLKFLSPCPGAKLGVLHASDWHWNKGRDTVLILPKDNDTLDYAENNV